MCIGVYNSQHTHYGLMRTEFNVIIIDKFSSYLTVNTVFILKRNCFILFTGIIVIHGDHHVKHTNTERVQKYGHI